MAQEPVRAGAGGFWFVAQVKSREIQRRVERRLGQAVNTHSVVALLSSAAHDAGTPVVKISPGRYRLLPPEAPGDSQSP